MIEKPFSDPLPIPDPQERQQFFGQFILPDGRPQEVWAEVAHQATTPSPIVCNLRYPSPFPLRPLIPFNEHRELRIDVRLPSVGVLRLYEIGGGRYFTDEARFEPLGYDLIEKEIVATAGSEVYVSARLTHRGLMGYVSSKLHDLGEAKISWTAHSRDFSFHIDHYSEHSMFGREQARLVVQRPRLAMTWRLETESDTPALLNQAEQLLEMPLLCLSFLSRRTINWFELSVAVKVGQHGRKYLKAKRRVQFGPDEVNDPNEDPVLEEEEANCGEFARILTALEQSPLSSDLTRAIRYHISSFSATDLESRFIFGFAAFETLVNNLEAISPLLVPGAVGIGPLERAIRRVVKCYINRQGLPELVADSLRSKVGEFRRLAFVPKALHHLARLEVDTSNLWMDDATGKNMLAEGLARTSTARNVLVHNTSIGDRTKLRTDLACLQCLFERLLLAAIEVPRPTSSRALGHAHWLGQQW